MIRHFRHSVIIYAAMGAIGSSAAPLPPIDASAAQNISFHTDVRPILKRHCWACHTGDEAGGALKLDSLADMLRGGETGPLFTPGKPDESLLVQLIAGDEPAMPKKQPRLSAAKLAVLRGWILAGAKDDSPLPAPRPPAQTPTYRFPPAVTAIAISPDGKMVAAACRGEVVLLDSATLVATRRLPTQNDLLTDVQFSSDGTLLAIVGGSPARHGDVQFIATADASVRSQRRIGEDTLFRGSFSPDGQSFAVGGPDGCVHIVPVAATGEVRKLDLHSDWVMDVAYTPDGKMLVSGGRDKATKVTSVETGRLVRAVDASTACITAVAADEQFAISSGRSGQLTAYEFKTALEGVEIIGGGNDARPVNRRDQYAKPFEDQPGEVLDLATSGDRKLLAVAGAFGEVRVYRTVDRGRAATVANISAPAYALALNADGSRLAVGTKAGQVQLFELPSGTLLKAAWPVPVSAAPTN